ncbi:MAG: hypothetical protein JO228_15700 [Xanthobacteraceae bacterium]|nr:hypothetical protein [Xanthobacteraceae bacterium]
MRRHALLIGLASGLAVTASAQNRVGIEALREQGYSVRMISPIFSQLVMLSLPKGFATVFENTSGNQYTREAVLDGESVERWSQMITVTGAKGLAANARVTAQSFVEQIAGGFKNACPDTFSAKGLGGLKISGRDAYIALAGCGTLSSDGSAHSESALLVAIKGTADIYTIQWAERGPASARPITFDETMWKDRFDKLGPIKLCPLKPGEAPPYPSCANQK